MKELLKWVTYGGIFTVPFLVLVVTSSMFFPYITGKNFYFRIIVEVITASWALYALYEPKVRPRFSWIFVGLVSFIGVMFFANLFGEYPLKSFWSNYERMEGYVTLVHLFLYFVVTASALNTEKLWRTFFKTSVGVAIVVALYSFAQLAGEITINQGGWRLDSTFGNSAYMAIYMIFHIFIVGILLTRTHTSNARWFYRLLIAAFVLVLILTGTRSAILGIIGGGFFTLLYVLIFANKDHHLRRWIGGLLLTLVVVGSVLFVGRNSDTVKNNQYLHRLTTITLSEGTTRFVLWDIAVEGIKERPLLGWGQENFNYVFNKHYRPELYKAEQWYDRVHNVVFDWLIAGGILGALTYFSLILSALYYVFIRTRKKEYVKTFTPVEQGVLLGLFAAYFFHNLFVFDNIISYILYITMLAYIHQRVGVSYKSLEALKISRETISHVVAPIAALLLVVIMYSINVPAMRAGATLIDAFHAPSADARMFTFKKALQENTFGNQEIREQLIQNALVLYQSPSVSNEAKQRLAYLVDEEIRKQVAEKPGDARVHMLAVPFYRVIGEPEIALQHLDRAGELSPEKQQVYIDRGLTYLQYGAVGEARTELKRAFDAEPDYPSARVYYALVLAVSGEREALSALAETDSDKNILRGNETLVGALIEGGMLDILE